MEILPCLDWRSIAMEMLGAFSSFVCLAALSMDLGTFCELKLIVVDARRPIFYHHLIAIMLNESIICSATQILTFSSFMASYSSVDPFRFSMHNDNIRFISCCVVPKWPNSTWIKCIKDKENCISTARTSHGPRPRFRLNQNARKLYAKLNEKSICYFVVWTVQYIFDISMAHDAAQTIDGKWANLVDFLCLWIQTEWQEKLFPHFVQT